MKKRLLFLVAIFFTFSSAPSFSADGRLTIIQNARKNKKPQRITVNLTLRENNMDLNLGRVEVDATAIVVSATGESQVLIIECNGFMRGGKTNTQVSTKIVYAVPANDYIKMPNVFNPKSFKMRIEFLDHSGATYYIGRELHFNFP